MLIILCPPLEKNNDVLHARGQAATFLNFTLIFSMLSPKVLDEADDEIILLGDHAGGRLPDNLAHAKWCW